MATIRIFDPSAPLGSISRVAQQELKELQDLAEDDVALQAEAIREEMEEQEKKLLQPGDFATDDDFVKALKVWDEMRQWLQAAEEEMRAIRRGDRWGRMTAEELDAAMKSTAEQLDQLEDDYETADSHDEMAALDARETELLARQDAIEAALLRLAAGEEGCGCRR